MEKKLTYEEYVKVQNLLTKIKSKVNLIDDVKDEIYDTIDQIKSIIEIKN